MAVDRKTLYIFSQQSNYGRLPFKEEEIYVRTQPVNGYFHCWSNF